MTTVDEIAAEVDAIVTAILHGDRGTAFVMARSMHHPDVGVLVAGDVIVWALRSLAKAGDGVTPEDLWAAWLVHKAAGFPEDEETDR